MVKKRFKEFIGTGTLTIFDIDETLFHTKAKVAVMKDGKVARMLDNQEFNTYKLKAGESFDFKEFKSAEVFRKTSTPIVRMVEKAKILVKSRNNAHGIPIDQMHVERSGNLGISSPAEAKKVVFRKYLNTKNYTKTRLYDDAMSNLKAFLELQSEYPNIEFEAWFVNPDGSVKRIK